MFANEIELKRFKSEDFSSYQSILNLGSSEDILSPTDIAGYKVASSDDYEKLLSAYSEEGNGIFALRRIVDGETVGWLAEKKRNNEASIGVFVGKPYRNFQYATTSIEEALEAIDPSKVKSVSFEVPTRDKKAVYLAEHFTKDKAIANGNLAVYKVDVKKHKSEYIPRMVGLELEHDLCTRIGAMFEMSKSPERDDMIKTEIASFIADHPNVNGRAIISKIGVVLGNKKEELERLKPEEPEK